VKNQSTDPKLIQNIELVIKRYKENNSVSECEYWISANQASIQALDNKIEAIQNEIDNLKAAFGITE
jgi:peptidoglycan hydrolase CwlO-like protein